MFQILQVIPSNPFEYGVLGLLAISWIVAIRYLAEKEKNFEKKVNEKKDEYLLLLNKKDEEIKSYREELKSSNEQRFEIVKQNIELSMELINAIDYVRNSKNK